MQVEITVILIVIISAISILAFNNDNLLRAWIFHPVSIRRNKQYYRFLTSGFLHADWGHLILNMFTFYFFGRVIEITFMRIFDFTTAIIFYLLILLGGIIVSSIPTYIKHKNDYNYHSLGASGGVSAVVFASILYYPVNDICLYFFICLPGFILGFIYLAYSYYQSRRMSDNINHEAHFYGAVYGFVVAVLLVPQALPLFWEQISNWSFFN